MAPNKSKKERREEIRRARVEAQRKRAQKKRRKKIITIVSIVVIVGLAGGFGVLSYATNTKTTQSRIKDAGCSAIKEFPDQGRTHLKPGEPHAPYNSDPPTSGPHADAPAPWGVYTDTLEPERLVHNLEHGGTVVHYRPKDLSDDEITRLEDFVEKKFPNGAIVNPNPDISKPVALASWRHLQTCEKLSIEVVEDFIRKRCNKGPEPVAQCGRLSAGQV